MENLKPNEQRAKTVLILLWIVLSVEIISLVSYIFQYLLLQSVANGEGVSEEAAANNDLRQRVIGIVYVLFYIVSGITFIMWFRRAYFNLHTKIKHLSFNEGWAAGAWFVPVIALFRPYQIMKELYYETEILLSSKLDYYTPVLNRNYLGIWWALWIISSFLGQFVFRYSLKANTVDELLTVTTASIINSLIGIPLGLITIKIVKDYSSVELFLFELKEETTSEKISPGQSTF